MCFCVDVEHICEGAYEHAPSSLHYIPPPPLSFRPLGKMSSPPSEDPLAAFNFVLDFLPVVDFGEGFQFDQPFHFDDFGGVRDGLPSFSAYDDDSCLFSDESSVLRRSRRSRRCKQRNPNRHYQRESVLLSSWYRSFLRPGMTRDLTHELSVSDRFGEFRSLFQCPSRK